jgi:hypothetical protein
VSRRRAKICETSRHCFTERPSHGNLPYKKLAERARDDCAKAPKGICGACRRRPSWQRTSIRDRSRARLAIGLKPGQRLGFHTYVLDYFWTSATVITGHRRDEIDRVVGLELGADDYVTKSFNLRELLARVRAIIRRLDRVRASPAREPERGGYRFSGWQTDAQRNQLRRKTLKPSSTAAPFGVDVRLSDPYPER